VKVASLHFGGLIAGILSILPALTASGQTNDARATLTVQHAAGVRGWVVSPLLDTSRSGITLFYTLIVDNRTGEEIAAGGPTPGRERTYSVFDSLFLCVCDDAGRIISREPYRWQELAAQTRYLSLAGGRTTNELFYFIPGALPANLAIRLEGRLGSLRAGTGSLTSNVVNVKVR